MPEQDELQYYNCNRCGNYSCRSNATPEVDMGGNPLPMMASHGWCRSCAICTNCRAYAAADDNRRCTNCVCNVDGCTQLRELLYDVSPLDNGYMARDPMRTMICESHYREKYIGVLCRTCESVSPAVYYSGLDRERVSSCERCAVASVDYPNRRRTCCSVCHRPATTYNSNALLCNGHASVVSCSVCNPRNPCVDCLVQSERNERITRQSRLARIAARQAERQHSRRNDGTCNTDCRPCASLFQSANHRGMPVFHPAIKISERRKNRSSRFISVEIEVAGIRNRYDLGAIDLVLEKWGARRVADGSLPSGGFEINTAPAAGDHFIQQITEICDVLKAAGAYVDESCGLHVHADARDFKYADMRNLVLLWEKLEPAFMSTQSAARSRSHYCRPVGRKYADAFRTLGLPDFVKAKGKPNGVKTKFFDGVYGTRSNYNDFRPARDSHYDDSRYHNLNLHSWIYRGTVENRLHSGTIVARKIIDWATTWAKFMDMAYVANEKEIGTITDPVDYLITRVASNKSAADYLKARMRTYESGYERSA